MALTIEHLYKARDFVDLKNITANHIELSFKNPIIAMLAKGKVAEIAGQCGPNQPFLSCEQNGNDLKLTYDPEIINEYLLGQVFTADSEQAQKAVHELSEHVSKKIQKA